MNKTAVVYFPPCEETQIQEFRTRYDTSWQVIPPHITIVSPLSEISDDQLISLVEEVALKTQVFPIRINKLIKSFDDYLLLRVTDGEEKINALHDTMYADALAPYLPTEYPFEPHITLGYFRDEQDVFDQEKFDSAFAEAEAMQFDLQCMFDALTVIKGDGISPSKMLKTIPLLRPS